VTHSKEENADLVVDSIDELFDTVSTSQDAEGFDASVDIQNTHQSEGGAANVSVFDSNGNQKNRIEYIRVPEMGSVECYKLDDGSWAVTRRDKLPHNQ
jgi:hypothetical protein